MVDVPFGYDVEVKDVMKLLKDVADNYENANMTSRLIVLPPTAWMKKHTMLDYLESAFNVVTEKLKENLERLPLQKQQKKKSN